MLVCALTAFYSFFSKSSKRTVLLTEQGFKLPQATSTRWNFHSRAVNAVKNHFHELKAITRLILVMQHEVLELHRFTVWTNGSLNFGSPF